MYPIWNLELDQVVIQTTSSLAGKGTDGACIVNKSWAGSFGSVLPVEGVEGVVQFGQGPKGQIGIKGI